MIEFHQFLSASFDSFKSDLKMKTRKEYQKEYRKEYRKAERKEGRKEEGFKLKDYETRVNDWKKFG